jgi:RNA polymerase-binding protein DksA
VTVADVDAFRQRLLQERERVTAAIEYLHRANPGSIEDEVEEMPLDNHLAEMATVTVDREIDYSLEENETRLLEAIDAALKRIDAGAFGLCAGCGRTIDLERLDAIPHTTLCIDCKRREERA